MAAIITYVAPVVRCGLCEKQLRIWEHENMKMEWRKVQGEGCRIEVIGHMLQGRESEVKKLFPRTPDS